MRKFILLFLALAIGFSADCRDLMNSNYTCPLKKSKVSSIHTHCHKQKNTDSKKCSCPEKKSVSINDTNKEIKGTFLLELVFHSPLNYFYSSKPATNTDIFLIQKLFLPFQDPPTKTIHLLI